MTRSNSDGDNFNRLLIHCDVCVVLAYVIVALPTVLHSLTDRIDLSSLVVSQFR